jgi:hypothetical protein
VKLVSHIYTQAQIEGVLEHGAYENILTKRVEGTAAEGNLHFEYYHNFYSSRNIMEIDHSRGLDTDRSNILKRILMK